MNEGTGMRGQTPNTVIRYRATTIKRWGSVPRGSFIGLDFLDRNHHSWNLRPSMSHH